MGGGALGKRRGPAAPERKDHRSLAEALRERGCSTVGPRPQPEAIVGVLSRILNLCALLDKDKAWIGRFDRLICDDIDIDVHKMLRNLE